MTWATGNRMYGTAMSALVATAALSLLTACGEEGLADESDAGDAGDAGADDTDGADAGGADAGADPYYGWVHLFDYDASVPLDFETASTDMQDGMTVSEVSYRGALDRVPATLVEPPGDGPFPGIVFLHWGGADRSEFLDEAVALAASGAVGLSIDAPWNRPDPVSTTPDEAGIQIVIDVRRGVDLLDSLPNVDGERLAFVGHSYGASRGGVLAGIERRFDAFALMTGYGRPSVYDGESAPSSFMDGIHYVNHAAPASLLFQFASADEYVTEAQAYEFYTPASEPKEIVWYDSGHALNAAALGDRGAFLAEALGF
mgnify:CR=1 FL=1